MNVGEKYLPQGDGVEGMIDSGFTFFFFLFCEMYQYNCFYIVASRIFGIIVVH